MNFKLMKPTCVFGDNTLNDRSPINLYYSLEQEAPDHFSFTSMAYLKRVSVCRHTHTEKLKRVRVTEDEIFSVIIIKMK